MAYKILYNGQTYAVTYSNQSYSLKVDGSQFQIVPVIDLSSYLKISVFNGYTGTTAPNQFASRLNFNLYTGTTAPSTYLKVSSFNPYSASTLSNINSRLLTSLFNSYSGSTGTRISTIEANYITGATNGIAKVGRRVKLGGALTGATTIDQTSGATVTLKLLSNNLGSTQIDGKGLWLQNSTSAGIGTQQVSPSITFEGQGWKTNTTAGSQSVKFRNYVLPIQGTTNPTGTWGLYSNINNATGNTQVMTVDNVGNFTAGNGALTTSLVYSAGNGLRLQGQGIALNGDSLSSSSGVIRGATSLTTGGGSTSLTFSYGSQQQTAGTNFVYRFSSGSMNPTSGNATINTLTVDPGIAPKGSQSGGTFNMVNIVPSYTFTGRTNTVVGLLYAPTITSMVGVTHIGILSKPTGATNGFGLNTTLPTATVDIGGSANSKSSLRIRSGTAPTSPNDGDIWYDGTNLKMRVGGVTKTFTLT